MQSMRPRYAPLVKRSILYSLNCQMLVSRSLGYRSSQLTSIYNKSSPVQDSILHYQQIGTRKMPSSTPQSRAAAHVTGAVPKKTNNNNNSHKDYNSKEASSSSLTRTTLPLRSLPEGAYLAHATNCLGEWGAGIALELRGIFPAAFRVYRDFCESFRKPSSNTPYPSRDLAGRCLVIPPQEADVRAGAPRVFIVCLFTSYGYGAKKGDKPGRDGVKTILEQTGSALREMRILLEGEVTEKEDGGNSTTDTGKGVDAGFVVYSPMFNSGAFKVPWERTEALIHDAFKDWTGRWIVLTPP
jgi:ADP-ribose 1''-phosphate phosphatase